MKRLLIAAVLLLAIAVPGYCAIAPGGPDDFSSGAEVIYAQPETREVYGSGALVPGDGGKWRVVFTDPVTSEACNGSLVLVFRLPERGSQLIEARSLMFKLGYIYNSRVENVDLYGIDYFAASEVADPNFVVSSDMFYIGAWGADPDATALDQGIVTTADVGGGGTLDTWFADSAEGALRLSCWLNSLYDEGAIAGDYVLLRLNYSLKYTVYTNLNIFDSTTTDNVRIYYDLVDNLSETCPGPVIPDRECTGLDGDLTEDCIIDLDDFVVMATDWLRCERIPDRLCN
ncbi:MAG: hypothetical protein ACIAQZ_07885 [Sedimentisphaeraceae bacterium JB056]